LVEKVSFVIIHIDFSLTFLMNLRIKASDLLKFYKGWNVQCQGDFGMGLTQEIDYLWSINYKTGSACLRFDTMSDLNFWIVMYEDRTQIHCPKHLKSKKGSPYYILHLGQHIYTVKHRKNPMFFLDIVFCENF
jgi:hypothetical protein